MAQTAITKALQQLQSKIKDYDGIDNAATCFNDAIQILTDLLPYERETIEAAYGQGDINNSSIIYNDNPNHDNSGDYFTKTYNQ
jgi:hypothetical protein